MRPKLNRNLDSESFRNWYWLKSELVRFCRDNDLPVSGTKIELTERIAYFLETGKVQEPPCHVKTRLSNPLSDISLDSLIEPDFVCTERHRAFFREQLGNTFSFNVAFQKWLKANAGKTYADAVAAYYEIKANKNKKKTIDRQFEYNTYVRDFFEKNKGRSLDDAIKCWKYKKARPGPNHYEDSDLAALED